MKLDIPIGKFVDTAGKERFVELHLPSDAETGGRLDQSPRAVIEGPTPGHLDFSYYVSSILEAARHPGRTFLVANGFGDDIGTFVFPHDELVRMAVELERVIPAKVGLFRVTWTPDNPDLPF